MMYHWTEIRAVDSSGVRMLNGCELTLLQGGNGDYICGKLVMGWPLVPYEAELVDWSEFKC